MSEILIGAKAIAVALQELGVIQEGDPDATGKVYYLAKKKYIPTGKLGRLLVASPAKLQQAIGKLAS